MSDWKPDKNKICCKCENWEKGGVTKSTPYEPGGEGYGNNCMFWDMDSEDEYLFHLFSLIKYVEECRMEYQSDGEYYNELDIVFANICPLYKEE
ncbi:MAG: hypothetical protein ISP01_05495 [Methanobrevibacter arboriphilus]|uniref:Uncharacterized protein n=1 Tax=Methanobrevibacter arboriphilus TaxID=39441 RepID=A0A843AG16_METAZ|nr:hypothetical protein [Methanobrevibacter arboriphilus]MBF4468843.1 hypothetical protein [Methanobrevibacter arboriphilus]